jgi:YD repeat-containing protein
LAREYQYSGAGNIASKNTEHGSYTYQYDALYRLSKADNPNLPDEAYTYDALGNRLTAAGIPGQWSYNANNELLGYGSKTFSYDLNGNMTGKADAGLQTAYIYDVEDRLVRVERGSSSVIAEYHYDPFGRRLWKDVDGVSNRDVVNYLTCTSLWSVLLSFHAAQIKNRFSWVAPSHHVQGHRKKKGIRNRCGSEVLPGAIG